MRDQPRERDRIQCLVCGRWFRALPRHLAYAHGYSDEDYRLEYGIPVGVPLVCLDWSERQRRRNLDRDAARTLTAEGPEPGYRQRESVRRRRAADYTALAAIGRAAAARIDRIADRLARLAPYPVTVDQAAERLGCTRSAAYTFLSARVRAGRLIRIGRGLYDRV